MPADRTITAPCGHTVSEAWLLSTAASIVASRGKGKTGGAREGAGRKRTCECGVCWKCRTWAKRQTPR